MSTDWVKDIREMHAHYDMHDKFDLMDSDQLKKFLEFRVKFLQEELDELKDNMENPEEIVDALIDLCVVAIGTLDAYMVDSHAAWSEVLWCNMQKKPGVKPERPNPLGLPDLIKPEGWKAPSHEGNHARFEDMVSPDKIED